ncbi:MAG: hypothetical protein AB7S75_25180 [Desulfococcaceae bacterium]
MKCIPGEFFIAVTFFNPEKIFEIYAKRWQIETMSACLRTRGFRFESTNLRDPDRISRRPSIISPAFVWAYIEDDSPQKKAWIPCQKHFQSRLKNESEKIDPTHQIRMGAEYYFSKAQYPFALCGGIFYDPAPAEGNPDNFFGFSLGSGIKLDRFGFDVAYQYRFGKDVGESILKSRELSQDIHEHTVYSSLIIYF